MTSTSDDNRAAPASDLKSTLDRTVRKAFSDNATSARHEHDAVPSGRWGWLATVFAPGNRVLPPNMAFFELAVFAIVVLLEWQVDAFPDLTRMVPHPYWIAVLLLSLQYGTVAGLAAAAVAIAGQVLIGLPEPDIEERYFNYLIRVWTQPVLWLVVALLLGAFRSRQIEKREYLRSQIQDLETRGATLVDYTNNLERRVASLERNIAVSATPAQSRLLSALYALGDAAPGRWAADLGRAFNIAFPEAAISVWTFDDRALRAVITHNWPTTARWRTEVGRTEPLAESVIVARRSLNVASGPDEQILGGDGLVAIPILQNLPGGTTVAVGMLKIEDIDPAWLDAATADRLSVIARALAPALAQGAVQLVAADSSTSPAASSAAGRGATETTMTGRERLATARRWRGFGWLGGRQSGEDDHG